MGTVCAVLLNWNGYHDTLDCIHTLISADRPPDTIVVSDNASTDGSLKIISEQLGRQSGYQFVSVSDMCVEARNRIPSVVLLANDSNRGFAAGNNEGIRYALKQEFEYIWLLNNDTVVFSKTLEHLLECGRSCKKTGIWGSTIVYYDNPDTVQCAGGCYYNPLTTVFRPALEGYCLAACQSCPEPRLDYIYGASFFVHRKVFEKTGLLDERYFLFYEELDFCRRAARHGFKTGWCRSSIVCHKQGQSVGRMQKMGRQQLIAYHENLSTLIFSATHYPILMPFILPLRFLGKFGCALQRGEFFLVAPLLRAYRDFFKKLIHPDLKNKR